LRGYHPEAETQTELALLGVRMHTGLFSAIFCFLGAFLLIKYYDLYREKREQLTAAMKEKKLA